MPVATVAPASAGRLSLNKLLGAPDAVSPGVSLFQRLVNKPSWMKLFSPPSAGAARTAEKIKQGTALDPNEIQELMLKRSTAALNRVYQR